MIDLTGTRDPWRLRHSIAVVFAALVAVTLIWVQHPSRPAAGWLGSRPEPDDARPGHTLLAVGDIYLGDKLQPKLDSHGSGYPFRHLDAVIASADVVMGNLEAPITTATIPIWSGKKFLHRQRADIAAVLRDRGFDLLVLANNHVLDYGHSGLTDTIAALKAAGIDYVGGGPNERAARLAQVVDVGDTKVGVLAYMEDYGDYAEHGWFADGETPGCARLDQSDALEDIDALRQRADVVLVNTHYGVNYKPPTAFQLEISRALIDGGADIVNGHHPHVAQGVERRGKGIILYSLGNFVFGTGGRFGQGKPGYGLAARYRFAKGRLIAVELEFLATNNRLVNYQPHPIEAAEAREVWEAINEAFDTPVRWDGATAIIELAS